MQRSLSALLCALCLSLTASQAAAQAASWVSVAAGAARLELADETAEPPLLELVTGLGSDPLRPLIYGASLKAQTFFGYGTDLALLGRLATGGYALGDWGVALDLGGYARFWDESSHGGALALTLGAPWGVIASGSGHLGTKSHGGFSATIGIDFTRLTVFRRTGTNYFPNPLPIEAGESER